MKKTIDPYTVRAFFNYDSETGVLSHAFSRPGVKRGKEAGTIDESGTEVSVRLYRRVMLGRSAFYAQRIIWVWMTGEQPDDVDHIDGDGLNNKWDNLRNVSHKRNGRNQRIHSTNTSGTAGVCYRAECNKWRARIMVDGKQLNLGTFADKGSAIEARKEAEVKHGFG